ncbi:hypothetical protein [Pontibaca salina]|uniref:PRC-barrel domain-containing protein n=1 Tax=Pontibaca salina TaxID=2795731 RepID=A0A934HQK0_9RHOB|nr:hypothetical protein [Pontibaca salina]MBI6628755.1 hypothetical protein [Pontibaca salina]
MTHPANSSIPPDDLNTENLEGVQVYGLAEVEQPLGKITRVHRDEANTTVDLQTGGVRGIPKGSLTLDLARLSFIRNNRGVLYARTNLENLLNLGR